MNKDIRLCVSFLTYRKRRKLQNRLGAEGVLAFLDLLPFTAMSRPKSILSEMNNEDIVLDAQRTYRPLTDTPTQDIYQVYESEKRKLQNLGLSPFEYEARVMELAEKLGI